MRSLPYLVMIGLVGCVDRSYTDSVTDLADMPDLEVVAKRFTGAASLVELHLNTDAQGGCAVLGPSVTATLDGAPIRLVERGRSERDDDNYWEGCSWPTFLIETNIVAPGILVIEDTSQTITMPIGDRLATRTATLVPDGPWKFTPGQVVTLRWSPAIDLAFAPDVSLTWESYSSPTATISGDLLSFAVPNQRLDRVQLFIHFDRGSEDVPCTGARCQVTNQMSSVFEVFSVE